ncbi:MAG: restriction endonuclease subunit S [bacterium]|nr:restriction endonuclease subunit S [bacterium]
MSIASATTQESQLPWFEDYPENWEVKPARAYLSQTKIKNDGLQEKNLLSLSYGKIIKKDIEGYFGLLPASFETYQIVAPGQIVLRLTDLQNDKKSLRSALVRERGIITSAYVAVKVERCYKPEYLNYLLRAYDKQKVFYFLGGGVRQTADFSDFKKLPVLCPPRDVQEKIVEYLDNKLAAIIEVIEKKKKLIELLRQQRVAVITEAVKQSEYRKDIDIDLGNVSSTPKSWNRKRLRFLTDINPKRSKVSNLENIKVTFLPMPLVSETGALDLSEEKDLNAVYSGYTYFANGDVIVAKITPCFENYKGAAVRGLLNGVGFGSTEFHVLRPLGELNSRFLYYVTMNHFFRSLGELEMHGSAGQQRVPTLFIQDFICSYPDRGEQDEIVKHLDQETSRIDDLIEKTTEEIEKLLEFKASTIYSAVTGRIKL